MLWDKCYHDNAAVGRDFVKDVVWDVPGTVEDAFCIGVGEHYWGTGEGEDLLGAVFGYVGDVDDHTYTVSLV